MFDGKHEHMLFETKYWHVSAIEIVTHAKCFTCAVMSRFNVQNLVTKMEFHIKK